MSMTPQGGRFTVDDLFARGAGGMRGEVHTVIEVVAADGQYVVVQDLRLGWWAW